jgi:hypothetical protein
VWCWTGSAATVMYFCFACALYMPGFHDYMMVSTVTHAYYSRAQLTQCRRSQALTAPSFSFSPSTRRE